MAKTGLLVLVVLLNSQAALAQGLPVALTYNPGSSVKLEQIIGDCDYQVQAEKGFCQPTTSQTVTHNDILGNDIGYSFEANGKVIFLFGDTIAGTPKVNFGAHDPLAASTTTSGESGLLVNFYTNPDGTPLFVEPPGIAMGADDVPNSGIALSDGIYLIIDTGADVNLATPHMNDYSLLSGFNETTHTFSVGRTLSRMPGGHFIITSPHLAGSNVVMFGAGAYRASDIYLSMTPAATFGAGTGTQYFAGLVNGQPIWTNSEVGAVPVVQDNPLNGPAWPNDSPTVGNLSVAYSADLGLWLMTYDGGRQSAKTTGAYFTYAQQPWGPWAAPQLIFNAVRDNALGAFIHNPAITPDPPGDGLNGPTIGANDIYATRGGDYAPNLIERFTTVSGNTLSIYYTLSTWNPYTIVKMRSQFTIARTPQINAAGVVIHGSIATTASPGSLMDIYGINLAAAPASASSTTLPLTLGGVQVLVNNVAAPLIYVGPQQIVFQLPFETAPGAPSVVVSTNGLPSAPIPVTVQPAAPSILMYGNNRAVAINPDGSTNGPANGAKAGSVMTGYLVGSGPLDNAVITGAPSPASPLAREKLTTTAAVGGSPAAVQFAGMAPGLVGLMQLNFVLPTLAPGDYPLEVTIGGTTSNQALVTIQ